jgi:small subunit ribosomal protein S9
MSDETSTILATGRRKSSVARVRLSRGTGVVKINSKELDTFFPVERHRAAVLAPLKATKMLGKYDVIAEVTGGGMTGQSEAVMLGVARALKKVSADLDPALRESGMLTRDSRMKERKKYGRRGARRSFQFSKR